MPIFEDEDKLKGYRNFKTWKIKLTVAQICYYHLSNQKEEEVADLFGGQIQCIKTSGQKPNLKYPHLRKTIDMGCDWRLTRH